MKSKQEKLAKLFINEVPKFGWSRETLLQCAKKQRISTSVLAKLFPSFEYDVLEFIIAQNNTQVEKNYNSFNNSRLKTRDKIKTILELIHNNAENWKKIFIFLGKTGKNELLQASKSWDIEYKQRVSVTSNDSIVIEINKLIKK